MAKKLLMIFVIFVFAMTIVSADVNECLKQVLLNLEDSGATIEFIKATKWNRENIRLPSLPLKTLQKYSSVDIGMLIIRRHYLGQEALVKEMNLKNGFDYKSKKIKIALAATEDDIFSILKTGEFLNYHQVKKTNGESLLSQRRGVENRLIGINYGDENIAENVTNQKNIALIQEIRPKSAYLFLGDLPQYPDLGATRIRSQYGNIFAVMKNEVKDRAVFTTHDSLAANTAYTFNARPKEPLRATPDGHGDYSSYFEAQIYGRLTLDDVDYWMVDLDGLTPSEIKELKESSGTSLSKLLTTGIPVYKARAVSYGKRREVTKGTKINKD